LSPILLFYWREGVWLPPQKFRPLNRRDQLPVNSEAEKGSHSLHCEKLTVHHLIKADTEGERRYEEGRALFFHETRQKNLDLQQISTSKPIQVGLLAFPARGAVNGKETSPENVSTSRTDAGPGLNARINLQRQDAVSWRIKLKGRCREIFLRQKKVPFTVAGESAKKR